MPVDDPQADVSITPTNQPPPERDAAAFRQAQLDETDMSSPNEVFDADDEPLEGVGLDLYAQMLRVVVTEIRRAIADDRSVLPRDSGNEPVTYALAGLSHCCVLLEKLERVRADESLFHGYLVARACVETWLAAAYIFFARERGLAEIRATFGNSVRSQVQQIRESVENNRRRHREAVQSQRKVLEVNKGIAERNRRDGTNLPLIEVPQVPALPADNTAGTDLLLESVKMMTGPSISYDEMAKRIGPLAETAGAGGGNWSSLYDVPYRSMSNFGAHPTFFVLDSYIDHSDSVSRVRTETLRDWRVHRSTMDVVYLVALLGVVVLSNLGFDVSNLRGVTAWWNSERTKLLPVDPEADGLAPRATD